MTRRFAAALAMGATLGLLASPDPAPAQQLEEATRSLSVELQRAQAAHLQRVAIWGGTSLLAGLGLLAASRGADHRGRRGFAIQSAAWGAINLGIVGAATLAGPDPATAALHAALSAENGYGDVLLLNLGLNVGYIAVGSALAILAGRLDSADAVRGHGLGVIVQGLGLLALDGVAYAGSRSRLQALHDLAGSVRVGAVPF